MMKANLVSFLSVGLALIGGVPVTKATPIIYTWSGIGTGTLAGQAFLNVPVTISSTADTSQIFLFASRIYDVTPTSSTLTLVTKAGPISAALTGPTLIASNLDFPEVGISSRIDPPKDILGILGHPENRMDPLFDYRLDRSIGPIIGLPKASQPEVPTSAGTLVLQYVSPTVTFQAVVAPEPSTAALLVIGCVVALVVRRR